MGRTLPHAGVFVRFPVCKRVGRNDFSRSQMGIFLESGVEYRPST